MSKATKHKHVSKELKGDMCLPGETQKIVKMVQSRGNNLLYVVDDSNEHFLVSVPSKFRKCEWVKIGGYVLVEPIKEGGKVKAEIVQILTQVINFSSLSSIFAYNNVNDAF